MSYHITAEIEYLENFDNNVNNVTEQYNNEPECCNLGHTDRTYNGITSNVFSSTNPYIHAGCAVSDNRNLIEVESSYVLFYPQQETNRNLPNIFPKEINNNIISGFAKICSKGGELETTTDNRTGKIYCYTFYNEESNTNFVFRFPFQELFELERQQVVDEYFINSIINELSSENNERMFFKYKSKLIPTSFLLKYLKKIRRAVNMLRSNTNVWDQISNKQYFNQDSLNFLNDTITQIATGLEQMNYHGLVNVCQYFNIYEENLSENDLINTLNQHINNNVNEADEDFKYLYRRTLNIYINHLIYYPLTIEDINNISLHMGLEINSKNSIYLSTNKRIITFQDIERDPYSFFNKFIKSEEKNLSFDTIDWGEKTRIRQTGIVIDNYFNNRIVSIIHEYFSIIKNTTGDVWLNKNAVENYIINKIILLDRQIDNISNIIEQINMAFTQSDKIIINNNYLTLKTLYEKENFIKEKINNLLSNGSININFEFNDEQEIAINKMKQQSFTFVYGVAGAGKSHTLCKFINDNLNNDVNFRIMVPTGKAASVLKEKLTSINPATNLNYFDNIQSPDILARIKANISTYHSFLTRDCELYNSKLESFIDRDRKVSDPNLDLLIIDEISMMGIEEFYLILKFYEPQKLIVIGDIKQLPPVNAYGSIATSLYNYLNVEERNVFIASLFESRRANPEQAKFLTLANKLRDVELNLDNSDLITDDTFNSLFMYKYVDDDDAVFNDENKMSINEVIKKIYNKVFDSRSFLSDIILDVQSIDQDRFQILCPTKIKEIGTYRINNFIKNVIPNDQRILKYIKTKNDNNTGILNGMFGIGNANQIEFRNDNNRIFENFDKSKHELAYAITIHKSQGSGFDNVVLILPKNKSSIISRELIYTAITRPKQKLFIVYHENNLDILKNLKSLKPRNMQIFETDILNNRDNYPTFEFKGKSYISKIDLLVALLFEKYRITNYSYDQSSNKFIDSQNSEFNITSYIQVIQRQLAETNDLYDFIKVLRINNNNINGIFNDLNLNIRIDENVENFMNSRTIYIPPSDLLEITLANGITVRSISEAVLATLFEIINLPYFYETELWANSSNNILCQISYPGAASPNGYTIKIRPDFAISRDEFRKDNNKFQMNEVIFFIEHLGMLNDENYLNHWKGKIGKYIALGYKVIPLNSINGSNSPVKIWDEFGKIVASEYTLESDVLNKICFTTNEEDFNNMNGLLDKLNILKSFYLNDNR